MKYMNRLTLKLHTPKDFYNVNVDFSNVNANFSYVNLDFSYVDAEYYNQESSRSLKKHEKTSTNISSSRLRFIDRLN